MPKAVLVGCGAMSRGWLTACAKIPNLTIVGLVDLDLERARRMAAEFALDGVLIGADLDQALTVTRPDCLFDVVVPAARAQVVKTGFAHNCHVLSEKPMASSLAEARELVALARETGHVHAIVQNRRYVPGIRRMRRFLASGAIGKLTGLHCDFFVAPHFGGFREQMRNVLLLDMAIHTLDAARYLADARPTAVYCLETNPPGSWYAHGAAANAIFEFADDIVFTYRGSWCAEGLRTAWESEWRLVGTQGSLRWDGAETFHAERAIGPDALFSRLETLAVPPLHRDDRVDGHLGVLRDFLAAIAEGRSPETVSHDNIASLAMVSGAIDSAAAKQRIPLES